MNVWFLGALAKLRKETASSFVSAHLYVRTEQLEFDWTDFQEIRYLTIFRNSAEKIQDSLKYDKDKRLLCMKANIHI